MIDGDDGNGCGGVATAAGAESTSMAAKEAQRLGGPVSESVRASSFSSAVSFQVLRYLRAIRVFV